MNAQTIRQIIQMYEGGQVERCHTLPHHGSYSVAQHSFNMLLLMEALHPDPSKELYSAILRHDLFERWTGDTPTCAKMVMPQLRPDLEEADRILSDRTGIHIPTVEGDDKRWMKALDWLEFLMWVDYQIGLGYRALEGKRTTVLTGMGDLDLPKPVREFLEYYRWQRTDDVPS